MFLFFIILFFITAATSPVLAVGFVVNGLGFVLTFCLSLGEPKVVTFFFPVPYER
jgi:hypothetical protein